MFRQADYWESRYEQNNTPWDLGYPSPALMDFALRKIQKNQRVLIPGAGRAPEIGALWNEGYDQVYICDWSESAIDEAKKMNPQVLGDRFLCINFFELVMDFEFILEQTFFCAIEPELRPKYVEKAGELLRTQQGTLAGVFFHREFEQPGPPYGGYEKDYHSLFEKHFTLVQSGLNPLAIKPREGHELFMEWKVS